MSEKKPPSWFDRQAPRDDADEERRRKHLLEELPGLMARRKERTRSQRFEPYLLVRSVLGDRGDRPINVPFWESPDIWTAHGDPSTSPDVPPDHGGQVVAGAANTVYAHVWNLGFAPLAGVRVEFYWCDPSLGIDGPHAHLIGVATCELSGRAMPGSHKLVKCPKPWVPTMENGGHECLVVRVSGLGDPVGNNAWAPWLNRHVAQRNISVVSAGASTSKLLGRLDATRVQGAHLQLIQVGHREGATVAQMIAPHLRVAPDIATHVLGELVGGHRIALAQATAPTAGMFAPVHAMAHGHAHDAMAPVVAVHGGVSVVDAAGLLGVRRVPAPHVDAAPATTHLEDLFAAVDRLHPPGLRLQRPRRGEAYLLRMATYRDGQLVGGYTMIVGERRA